MDDTRPDSTLADGPPRHRDVLDYTRPGLGWHDTLDLLHRADLALRVARRTAPDVDNTDTIVTLVAQGAVAALAALGALTDGDDGYLDVLARAAHEWTPGGPATDAAARACADLAADARRGPAHGLFQVLSPERAAEIRAADAAARTANLDAAARYAASTDYPTPAAVVAAFAAGQAPVLGPDEWIEKGWTTVEPVAPDRPPSFTRRAYDHLPHGCRASVEALAALAARVKPGGRSDVG